MEILNRRRVEVSAATRGPSGPAATRRQVLAAPAAALLLANAPGDPTVQAAAGRFTGTREGGVAVFRGIRYGRAERFRAPKPVPAGEFRAQAFGPIAPQRGNRGAGQSEDCLFLNVWTPAAAGARLPVMVYFHGGAYSTGTSTDPLTHGHRLAARGDVVVVTVNHRLNALGYLYLARFDPRLPDSGNAGQLDLILALQWVRDNIRAFGGDPGRVMVFGQSGGGAKIATLMGMPAAQGLFHRAATMSGQQVTASGPLNATSRARAFLARLGVREDRLEPLLSMPVERVVEGLDATDPILGGGVYMGPVLDMKWLVRHPFWPDANPLGNGIPMILGNTRDETRAFVPLDSPRLQGLDWNNLPERLAPELRIDILPEWVVAQYRQHFPELTPVDVFYRASTAGRSWRGQVIEAEARADAGVPGWVYQLDFASRVDPRRGAFHTMDIPLVFGTLDAEGSETGTGPDARACSSAMQDAFVRFTATGNPNGGRLPRWPRYERQARATMIFDTASRVENNPRGWERELFARVPYIQPGT